MKHKAGAHTAEPSVPLALTTGEAAVRLQGCLSRLLLRCAHERSVQQRESTRWVPDPSVAQSATPAGSSSPPRREATERFQRTSNPKRARSEETVRPTITMAEENGVPPVLPTRNIAIVEPQPLHALPPQQHSFPLKHEPMPHNSLRSVIERMSPAGTKLNNNSAHLAVVYHIFRRQMRQSCQEDVTQTSRIAIANNSDSQQGLFDGITGEYRGTAIDAAYSADDHMHDMLPSYPPQHQPQHVQGYRLPSQEPGQPPPQPLGSMEARARTFVAAARMPDGGQTASHQCMHPCAREAGVPHSMSAPPAAAIVDMGLRPPPPPHLSDYYVPTMLPQPVHYRHSRTAAAAHLRPDLQYESRQLQDPNKELPRPQPPLHMMASPRHSYGLPRQHPHACHPSGTTPPFSLAGTHPRSVQASPVLQLRQDQPPACAQPPHAVRPVVSAPRCMPIASHMPAVQQTHALSTSNLNHVAPPTLHVGYRYLPETAMRHLGASASQLLNPPGASRPPPHGPSWTANYF